MKKEKVQNLIQVAKNLKTKQKNQQITDFEEEELKEIYRALTIEGNKKKADN